MWAPFWDDATILYHFPFLDYNNNQILQYKNSIMRVSKAKKKNDFYKVKWSFLVIVGAIFIVDKKFGFKIMEDDSSGWPGYPGRKDQRRPGEIGWVNNLIKETYD